MSTNAFFSAMDARAVGENGAPCEASTGNPLVSLFFKLVRDVPAETVTTLCAKVGTDAESLADLVVLAFQTRAVRGMGKGEKLCFYQLLEQCCRKGAEDAVLATLHLVPHFGYWKDVLLLQEVDGISQRVKDKAIALMAERLKADAAELEAAKAAGRTPKLSLAGKYAPREGSHFNQVAKGLARALFGKANEAAAQRKYRKLVSGLNAALNTTEVLMASARWSEIEFGKVASLCLQRHRKAFLNEAVKGKLTPAEEATGNRFPDDEGRVAARQHLREALVAKKGVKGKALQPHEVAAKCMRGGLSTLEADLMDAQWAALREGVKEAMAAAAEARDKAVAEAAGEGAGLETLAALRAALPKSVDLGNLVPLVDVSGSMHGKPMEAAIGLGILVSELAHPAFQGRCLTFESRPQWVELKAADKVADKVRALQGAGWGGSTDFEAACEQILAAAQRAKLKPDEVPDLIVFSDMQFDEARGGHYGGYGGYGGGYGRRPASWETHHERLERRFAEVGKAICGEPYAAPRIIYWNLRGDTVGFPVAADAPNTQMISGFSPALLKLVLGGKDLVADEKEVMLPDGTVKKVREGPTPEETLRAALDDAAFDPVRLALAAVDKGPLAGYTFVKDDFELVEAA